MGAFVDMTSRDMVFTCKTCLEDNMTEEYIVFDRCDICN